MFAAIKRFFVPGETSIELWYNETCDTLRYTPDLDYLEKYECHHLFVPDEMKSGFKQHSLLEGGIFPTEKPLPTVFTYEAFSLWKKPMGEDTEVVMLGEDIEKYGLYETRDSFAGSTLKFESRLVPKRVVKGELYPIVPQRYKQLDIHKKNRVKSVRQRIKVFAPYRPIATIATKDKAGNRLGIVQTTNTVVVPVHYHKIWAYAYLGNLDYYGKMIDKDLMTPVRRFTPKGTSIDGDYYCYTRLELENK